MIYLQITKVVFQLFPLVIETMVAVTSAFPHRVFGGLQLPPIRLMQDASNSYQTAVLYLLRVFLFFYKFLAFL
jgi:hypothetical protein